MLSELDSLGELVSPNKDEPTEAEWIRYTFFKHGIGYEEFQKTPIWYILSMVKSFNYEKKLEADAAKKASKRKI